MRSEVPLTVYCDRLSWWRWVSQLRELRVLARSNALRIRVLDPIPSGWQGRLLLRAFRAYGFLIEEEPFYAGKLLLQDGLPTQRAAAETSGATGLEEGARIILGSPFLSSRNRAWGRETVRVHLCKGLAMSFSMETSLYGYALRVQVARALATRNQERAVLLILRPMMFGVACLQTMAPEIRVVAYGQLGALVSSKQQLLRQVVRAFVRRMRALSRRATPGAAPATAPPSLLLLQEDDLGLDRSYRSQPHWILPEDPAPTFPTYVLAHTKTPRVDADDATFEAINLRRLTDEHLLAISAKAEKHPAITELRRDAMSCFRHGLLSSSPELTFALAMTARLFSMSAELAAACLHLNVRAFMTSETYLVPADALALVGERIGVHTLSYQYSNIAWVSAPMLTTADIMFAFAPSFHPYWRYEVITPRTFVDVGYPFDGAFARTRERAHATKARLRAAGAKFVIAYFDENFIPGKYGLTSPEEHCDELRSLLELVIHDPSVGLVTKTQFQRNSPGRLAPLTSLVDQARSTGRYLELVQGVHRNSILPVEAAQAADITIGHSIGGTAALEAALAGARAILLNPYGMRDANHVHYAKADILIPSLTDALGAIQQYRGGGRPSLGDWSGILDRFDAFRDGNSARRLRAAVELIMADARGPAESGLPARVAEVVARLGGR